MSDYIIGPNGEQYSPDAFKRMEDNNALGPGADWTDYKGQKHTTKTQISSKMPKDMNPDGIPQEVVTTTLMDEKMLDAFREKFPSLDDETLAELIEKNKDIYSTEETLSAIESMPKFEEIPSDYPTEYDDEIDPEAEAQKFEFESIDTETIENEPIGM